MSDSLDSGKIRRIAIIGSGAVGCYYGGRLAHAGCDVRFLMRRDLEHVRRHGLVVQSCAGDFLLPQVQAFGTTGEMGAVDLVIITLKATANDALTSLLPPLLHEGTLLLTLQNGLGNEEYLASRWNQGRVLGGVCFTCINRTAPGVIEHTAQGRISLGPHTPAGAPDAAEVCALFNRCGIECLPARSVAAVRWKKLVWNIPFNGLAVLTGLTTDRILADASLQQLVRSLMHEIIGLSCGLGFPLPDSLVEDQVAATRVMAAYRPSSMIDYFEGRDVEVEAIWGEPWRAARAAGLNAGRLEALYCLIRSAVDRRQDLTSGADRKNPAEAPGSRTP
jgi:2-dehydropantoate 2-reductase